MKSSVVQICEWIVERKISRKVPNQIEQVTIRHNPLPILLRSPTINYYVGVDSPTTIEIKNKNMTRTTTNMKRVSQFIVTWDEDEDIAYLIYYPKNKMLYGCRLNEEEMFLMRMAKVIK